MVRYLTETDVKQLLTMPLALRVVEEALKAHAEHRAIDVPRARIHLPTGTQHVLQAAAPELKVIGLSKKLGIDITPADSAEAAVRGAHVVNVITKAAEPVLKGEWLQAGQHVNAAGSNALSRREINEAAVRKCDVITVDGRGTARKECGDLLPAIEKGLLHWDSLVEIGEVIAGRVRGRTSARQITLYESHGMGIQDLYAGARVLELAREKGVGTDLPMGE